MMQPPVAVNSNNEYVMIQLKGGRRRHTNWIIKFYANFININKQI